MVGARSFAWMAQGRIRSPVCRGTRVGMPWGTAVKLGRYTSAEVRRNTLSR